MYKDKDKLIIAIIIFVVIYIIYNLYYYNINENLENISKYEKVCDDDNIIKIDQNICSRKCCGLTQYQSEFLKDIDDNSEERKKYVGSNMSCNFGDGSGCLCIPKDNYDYLTNRGIGLSCTK
jgi:hypothetical protein